MTPIINERPKKIVSGKQKSAIFEIFLRNWGLRQELRIHRAPFAAPQDNEPTEMLI
jgi:hypothetical protein